MAIQGSSKGLIKASPNSRKKKQSAQEGAKNPMSSIGPIFVEVAKGNHSSTKTKPAYGSITHPVLSKSSCNVHENAKRAKLNPEPHTSQTLEPKQKPQPSGSSMPKYLRQVWTEEPYA